MLQRGWTKPELLPAAYYTTVAWFMAYTFSIFSYLVGGRKTNASPQWSACPPRSASLLTTA